MKNIQFQSKLEQQLKDLSNEFEEKMLKQKEEISQMLNNKIEHLNMSLLSLDKNPKFIELDELKNKSNQLEKDIKEIKQNMSKGGEININNNQDQRLRKVKRKSLMYENENINGIFEHIKNNYLNIRKSNANIVSNNPQNSNNKFGSSSKLYYLENDKNNNLNENSPRYERKNKNKQQTLSPLKSKFHNESSTNTILNNNINNNVNNANKVNLSYKVLNNSKNSNNNNEEYNNKIDINKSKSIPKKNNSKSNITNMKDKIVSKDIYMNKSKTIENNNNSGGNNKNRSINNEIIKNISTINHSKLKNNNYNLTNPITEDSNSFISITNSSKDEDIINNTYNKTSNDLNTKTKLLFLNKKNNISNNISNMQDQKIPLNIMNKLEKNNIYLNKIKNMELDNNDSKINSKINYNKSQSNYREEIVKEFFTKYDKGNMTINLNQIKNKGNLDLYNYSISPPDNKFLGKAKINELYEPPFNKDIFFNNNNIIETNNLNHYYTKRNLSVKPSLNMQLYYGNYNMKKKEKNNKSNYLSNSNINGKNKHNIFGKTVYSDYVNKEDLFTMTSYKNKK